MEYKLIYTSSPNTLEVEVNDHLKYGWLLHGSTFCDNGVLLQAMVKEQGKENPAPPKLNIYYHPKEKDIKNGLQ